MSTGTARATGEGAAPVTERTVLFAPLGFDLAEVTRMIEVARAYAAEDGAVRSAEIIADVVAGRLRS